MVNFVRSFVTSTLASLLLSNPVLAKDPNQSGPSQENSWHLELQVGSGVRFSERTMDSAEEYLEGREYPEEVINELRAYEKVWIPEINISTFVYREGLKYLPRGNRFGAIFSVSYSSSDIFGVRGDSKDIDVHQGDYTINDASMDWSVDLRGYVRSALGLHVTPFSFHPSLPFVKTDNGEKITLNRLTITPLEIGFQGGASYVNVEVGATVDMSDTDIFQILGPAYIFDNYGMRETQSTSVNAAGFGWNTNLSARSSITLGDVDIAVEGRWIEERFPELSVTETKCNGKKVVSLEEDTAFMDSSGYYVGLVLGFSSFNS